MRRREALALGLAAAMAMAVALPGETRAQDLDVNAVLHDPDAPESGNPKGDVTIVAFFDYNCPFCKKAEPDLAKVVREDGNIRVVYKDWPILTESSVYGAQLALGARYQGKYQEAHDALMGIPGSKADSKRMTQAVRDADVDMARLQTDLNAHADEIAGLLRRNLAQADAMGLPGTPVFLIGPFKIAAALDADGFRQAVADARAKGVSQ